jgi:hypothetical protein
MTENTKAIEALAERVEREGPTCADRDEDCDTITDKVRCWLYDPAKGMCPYLRAITHTKGNEDATE